MFLFKRNKIIIDAFTDNVNAYHYAKPEKSNKFFPNWFKQMPVKAEGVNPSGMVYDIDTITSCSGVLDHFKNSFIQPLWSDLMIETKENGWYNYMYADPSSPEIISHPDRQYGHKFQEYIHIKICTPWLFQEKTGVNFVCVEPTWNLIDTGFPGKILPGTVQYTTNASNNVNVFLPKINNKIKIDYRTPLYQMFPQSEKEIEIKTHLVSHEEYKNMVDLSVYRFKFLKNYSFRKKTVGVCPFNSVTKR